jgi:hypothetical protein
MVMMATGLTMMAAAIRMRAERLVCQPTADEDRNQD